MSRRKYERSIIRLACLYCDTEEADGVLAIPHGWTSVSRVQTLEEAFQEAPSAKTGNASMLDWYTHLGVCANCKKEGYPG